MTNLKWLIWCENQRSDWATSVDFYDGGIEVYVQHNVDGNLEYPCQEYFKTEIDFYMWLGKEHENEN